MIFSKQSLITFIIILSFFCINAQEKTVYIFKINQEITPSAVRITNKAFDATKANNSDLIILHLNTYGGMLDAADSIRTKILNSKIPVFVFIDNNAASAGALISIACKKIYMRKGSSIGAATVVDQSGAVMPDKYQAYMRSMMRSTAESHGKDTIINYNDTVIKWIRDPLIAEAMVDQRTFIEGIIDSGKVLTFTSEEAIKYGYCEGIAENIDEVLKLENIENAIIIEHKISSLESIINLLLSPYLQGILIMIIIGGIYFELQTPGIGFPIVASIIAAVLYFAPLYLEGIAENWEIFVFIIGVALLLVEIFAIPGFGIAGFSGIALIILGLTLSMADAIVFEFSLNGYTNFFKSLFIVTVSSVLSLVFSLYFGGKILKSPNMEKIVLNTVQDTEDGFLSFDNNIKTLVNQSGISHTVLRPAGKIKINNDIYDAASEHGFIEKDKKILVTRFESGQLYVIEDNS